MKTLLKNIIKPGGLGALLALVLLGTAWAQTAPSVQGMIRDAQTNGVLEGAVVSLTGTSYRAKSARNGAYRLDEVPGGNYTLRVSYVGFEPFEAQVTVTDSGTTNMPITLQRVVRVADEIIVEGYRFGESKSLNDQKEAANIKNIISEEQIRAFPDMNTAEVLQRVSGINIQRDNGEGRFVAMRGTPSAMTNITVNGQQVAYSNGENRSVELDVVSAAQLTGIEVTKVLTPDMDADAVGGSINLQTRSAFDSEERIMRAQVGVGENSISDDSHARASFDFADVFGANDNIGFALGLNFVRTGVERHNNEQRWGDRETVDGTEIPMALRNSEVQFSDNVRDRYGLNTRFEYKFNDNHRIYASAVYNFREDDQDRQITRVRWDRGDYLSPTEVRGARIIKSLHDRLEEQKIETYAIGGEHRFGASILDFSVSTSSASTEKPKGQYKPEFEVRGVDIDMVKVQSKSPNWVVADPSFDINDGSQYEFQVNDVKFEFTESDIDSAALNFEMPMVWGSDTGTFKVGGKLRALDKVRADVREQWEWDGDNDLTLDQFEGNGFNVLESGYELGNVYNRNEFRRFFQNNLETSGGDFVLDENRLDVNLGEPYDAKEDVSSVYVMTTQEYGNLLVLGGFRYERTELDYSASNLIINRDLDPPDNLLSNELVNAKRDFNEVYPNLQFRYRLTPDTNLRLAYSEGMARPDFWRVMPSSYTDLDSPDDGVRGNPDLKPAISKNVDLLAEHFFAGIGVLSGGIFFKQIDDFNFQTTVEQIGVPVPGFEDVLFEYETYVNGGSADILGVELTWQQQFTQLPGWLSGFGVYANYTYTDASNIDLGSETDRTDIDALPEQVQDVWNLALIYEKDSVVSRLSANYTGKWIEEVGGDASEDEWRDEATTVDFSFTWMFENGIDVFFQANNLTDEVKYVYVGVPTRSGQHSITGRTMMLGATWTF